MSQRGVVLVACLALCGCATFGGEGPAPEAEAPPPAASVNLSETWGGRAAISVAEFLTDPIASNWEVKEVRVADDRFRLELRMKRMHIGGEGEAYPLFLRHAQFLTGHAGYTRFSIEAYQEGLNSNWIAQRVASGEIVLSH